MDQVKPYVGMSIQIFAGAAMAQLNTNGNTGAVAAVVTRVWDEESGMINATAFPDHGSVTWVGSIKPQADFEGGAYWKPAAAPVEEKKEVEEPVQ